VSSCYMTRILGLTHYLGHHQLAKQGLRLWFYTSPEQRFDDCVEIVGERLGNDAAYRLDSSKIRQEVGWTERTSLEQGIDETIRWVETFFDDLRAQPMHYIHKP